MDRKRDKKLACFTGAAIVFAAGIFLTAGIYMWSRFKENTRAAAQLSLNYPQAEGFWMEIQEKHSPSEDSSEKVQDKAEQLKTKYGYTPFTSREGMEFLLFFSGEVLLASFALGCLLYRSSLLRDREKQHRQEIMENLTECIKAYTRGTYNWNLSFLENSQEFGNFQEELEKMGISMSRLKERLESEEQHTKTLITDISHQLKTPLAALKVSLEMLEDQKLTQEERDEFLKQGNNELEKLTTHMDLLLNMSRLEGHMIHLNPQKRNLKETILEAVNTVIMKALGKNIEIFAETVDCMVKHDFRWTQEAVINLLDNAIKYSEPGTSIGIRMQKLTSYILIEILDQGMGIEKNEQHKIFHRFYRGEKAKELERDGAGVGLYLARKILEQQNGTLCVKERIDTKGSCFQIMLPLI